MNWILAGFGFALGMWLFMVALRWAAGHVPLLLGLTKWAVIVLALFSSVLLAFAWNPSAGIIVAAIGMVWFAWLALKALPPVTSPSREP